MAARAKKSGSARRAPRRRAAALARDRAGGREGDAHALGARQGAARDPGAPAGRLSDRARPRRWAPIRSSPCSATSARRSRRRWLARFGAGAVTVVEQTEQRGTGHAVRLAMPALEGFRRRLVLILYGDVPLLRRETLAALVGTARRYRCLAMVTATPPDPTGYGRIVRDERGHVIGVVEQKDATPEERAIAEMNAGIYCGPAEFFREATAGLSPRNAQGEYYLTDIVARAAEAASASPPSRPTSATSPASTIASSWPRPRRSCARASTRALHGPRDLPRSRRRPTSSRASRSASTSSSGRDVALRGRTKIGHGARIDDGVILTDTEVGAGAHVRPTAWRPRRSSAPARQVGPFAHLRPGTELGPDVHVGNFVETKKTHARAGQQGQPPDATSATPSSARRSTSAPAPSPATTTATRSPRPSSRTAPSSGRTRSWWRRCGSASGRWSAPGRRCTGDVPAGALVITRAARIEKPGYAQKVAKKYAAARKSG